MKLKVFNNFDDELQMIWNAIEPHSQHHVFQLYNLLKYWQETIGQCALGIKPWIAVVFNTDDQPKIIFPLGLRRHFGARVLEFLGGVQNDYLGPLIHNDWMSDLSKVECAWSLVCESLPRHDVRHFTKLPAQWGVVNNPMLKVWKSVFQDNSYSSRLPESFDEFQRKLRTKLKLDNKRQYRRLSEKGHVTFEVLDHGDGKHLAALNVMIEQKRQRCRNIGVPDIYSDKVTQQFYRGLQMNLSDGGRVHFSILRLDDQILATHWGLIYRNRFYFLIPTFDNKWGAYSPGRLLLENLIEWCIQSRLKVFDFTIGGEDYKKNWCDGEMPLFEHLQVVTPFGLLYPSYIQLRRYARRNKKIWGIVKFIYSCFRYGKCNDD